MGSIRWKEVVVAGRERGRRVEAGGGGGVSKVVRSWGGREASIDVGGTVGRVGATVVVEGSVSFVGDLLRVVFRVVEADERFESVFLELK